MIQRYDLWPEQIPQGITDWALKTTDSGRFVLYADHLAVLAEKDKELADYKTAMSGHKLRERQQDREIAAAKERVRELDDILLVHCSCVFASNEPIEECPYHGQLHADNAALNTSLEFQADKVDKLISEKVTLEEDNTALRERLQVVEEQYHELLF